MRGFLKNIFWWRYSWPELVLFAAMTCMLGSLPALADSPTDAPPTMVSPVDQNGVNMLTAAWDIKGPSISVGQPGKGGLTYVSDMFKKLADGGWTGTIKSYTDDPQQINVTLLDHTSQFFMSGSTYTALSGIGETLTFDGTKYTFTAHDGTVALFYPGTFPCTMIHPHWCTLALVTTITRPSGEVLSLQWRTDGSTQFNLLSVVNNLGYEIKVDYACATVGMPCYMAPTVARAINNAYDYCDPSATSCSSFSQSWPTLTLVTGGIQDARGNTTSVSGTAANGTVTWPSGKSLHYQPTVTHGIWTVTDAAGHVWQYWWSPGTTTEMLITDPLGHVRAVDTNAAGEVTAETRDWTGGGLNLRTSYQYDSFNRLHKITYDEGNYIQYTYDDARGAGLEGGNIIETRRVSKTPGTPADIVSTAVYPSSCSPSTYKVCNQPTSTTDANSNTTTYTYDTAHGGVLTVTGPAVAAGTPQTRFSYSQLYAWYKNSGGTIVSAATPVYELTNTSTCTQTSASCTGAAQERVTTLAYTSGSSSVPTNLLSSSTTVAAGNASLSVTNSQTYDVYSNVATTTGPISGSTSAYFYDLNHNRYGAVSPDPDGAGALKNPAARVTFDGDNRETESEQGTVISESFSDWSTFASLTQETLTYDTAGLPTKDTKAVGGAAQSVTQYTFDAAGNLTCTAVRLNASVFGSLPSSACGLSTTGSYGQDQITHNAYDAANRLTLVQSGYATATVINSATYTYTGNSKQSTVADANNNLSGYTYDGQDRLVQLNFPSKSTPGTVSTTDYEQYAYDANGSLIQKRLRSTELLHYNYDALNRVVSQVQGSGSANDIYYAYDLVGDVLYAHYGSAGGLGVDYSYDILGHKLTENSYGRTVSSAYDGAGNRTRLTYPDTNYIAYTFDVLNHMQQVQENGGTVLAQYTYDDLSRVTAITRANGATTSMTYNSTSWDWSLGLSGTSQNLTFGMNYTPSGQLFQRTVSNAAYQYSASPLSRSYTPNGLNQYASVSSTSYTYDDRGNLTSDGSRSFVYDLNNRLTTVTGSASASVDYDPFNRLKQTVTSSTEQYLYDGDSLLVEYDGSGNVLRRYVPGQGTDEALVWYEGSGLSSRHWLHADQQQSIIATSDASATATPYAYSITGEPSGGFSGAAPIFRYTGQAALSTVALYYYKARIYDPALNRFLQTDPASYSAGLNLYAYVGNDPANLTDPTGRAWCGNHYWALPGGGQVPIFDDGYSFSCSLLDTFIGFIGGGNSWGGGSGGGAAGGGDGNSSSANSVAATNQNSCPTGPYVSGSIGAGGTVAVLAGVNLGVSLNVDFPKTLDPSKLIGGFQVSISGQAGASVGGGLYGGGGVQYGLGISGSPTSTGYSRGYYAEADAGAGASYGGSVQVGVNSGLPTSASGSIGGKLGLGAGVYAGVGKYHTATAVLLGCHG